MLETFRDASAADLQAAGQAIARHEPQIFLRALHRLHGSAQILGITALQQLCAPFEAKRPDSLTPASCLEVVQRITGVMREIDMAKSTPDRPLAVPLGQSACPSVKGHPCPVFSSALSQGGTSIQLPATSISLSTTMPSSAPFSTRFAS
ncbi:Hpt domain-containing protein [Klebsiella pneumoniae subsp. pneumoniae]|nr:Hpt domain-containing protein [Klebsiella pneumoniae subsp. pneumoniae]